MADNESQIQNPREAIIFKKRKTSHSCMAFANFIGHSQVSMVKNPASWTLAILLAFEAEIQAVFVDL